MQFFDAKTRLGVSPKYSGRYHCLFDFISIHHSKNLFSCSPLFYIHLNSQCAEARGQCSQASALFRLWSYTAIRSCEFLRIEAVIKCKPIQVPFRFGFSKQRLWFYFLRICNLGPEWRDISIFAWIRWSNMG